MVSDKFLTYGYVSHIICLYLQWKKLGIHHNRQRWKKTQRTFVDRWVAFFRALPKLLFLHHFTSIYLAKFVHIQAFLHVWSKFPLQTKINTSPLRPLHFKCGYLVQCHNIFTNKNSPRNHWNRNSELTWTFTSISCFMRNRLCDVHVRSLGGLLYITMKGAQNDRFFPHSFCDVLEGTWEWQTPDSCLLSTQKFNMYTQKDHFFFQRNITIFQGLVFFFP